MKAGRRLGRGLGSPLAPACLALGVYLLFLAALGSSYAFNLSAFIGLGARDPLNAPGYLPSGLVIFQGDGYDGQYFYHIALGLVRRNLPKIDPMRYQRILYPLLAVLLAFGQEHLLPLALLLVNLVAMLGGTLVFAVLLRRQGLAVWYSLLFAFNPGEILGLQMDLALPQQMALAMGALAFWEGRRLWAASVLLACSILASESAVLFLVPMVAGELARRQWRGAGVLTLAAAPYLAYQGLLRSWMGAGGLATSTGHIVLPGTGMVPVAAKALASLGRGPLDMVRQGSLLALMAVMLGALLVSGWKLRKGYEVFTAIVFCHAAFSLLASRAIWEAYASAGRVFAGLFPLLVLSYGVRRERWSPILLGATAFLGLITLLRPFLVSPWVPFFITS